MYDIRYESQGLTCYYSICLSCFDGFHGTTCDKANCSSLNDCYNHGNCTDPNLCECDTGYAPPDCQKFSCETINNCSGKYSGNGATLLVS